MAETETPKNEKPAAKKDPVADFSAKKKALADAKTALEAARLKREVVENEQERLVGAARAKRDDAIASADAEIAAKEEALVAATVAFDEAHAALRADA